MNINMNQLASLGRHAVTFSMGVVTAAAALRVISGSDATTISNSISQISSGVAQIAAGLAPIIAIISAGIAAWKQSHTQQVATVKAAVNSGAIKGVAIVGEVQPEKGT